MKKKHSGMSLRLIAVFLVLCLIPSLGLIFTGPSEAGANEVLSPLPTLVSRSGKLNTDYLADLGDWLNDHFSLRQEMVTLWAKLNAALLHTSVTDSVILGSDGWLYYAPTLSDYTGSDPMTERELCCAARTLQLLQEYTEEQGASFLFTVAPNKNSLYSEHMPSYPTVSDEDNAGRLFALLEENGVHYTDLFTAFRAKDEVLYFASDSHWNSRGAALAADLLLEALGRESDYFGGPFAADAEHLGDLYEMLYPAGAKTETDYTYTPGLSYTVTSSSADPDSITLTTEGSGEGNLLLYRDSFGRSLFPYMADSFAQCTFSRKNDYNPLTLQEGDCLCIELVERNLRYLNEYTPTMPAPVRECPEEAESIGSVNVTTGKSGVEGYMLLSGVWNGTEPDANSAVIVVCGGTAYEAFPRPDGFSLHIPETQELTNARIYITVNGRTVSLNAVCA